MEFRHPVAQSTYRPEISYYLANGIAQAGKYLYSLVGDGTIVLSLAYSENYIFAGTMFKGVYKSTDYSMSWTKISSLRDSFVYALASSGNNIFADYAFLNNGTTGVYRSTNAGATWELVWFNLNKLITYFNLNTCRAFNKKH